MRPIFKGSTDQSVVIRILNSTDGTPEEAVEHDTSGLSLWYRREGGSVTAITPAALAAANSAHVDGGIEHLDDGYYRLDLPDPAVASAAGVNGVLVGGTVTGMVVVGCYVPLWDMNPYVAPGTNGGLPTVDGNNRIAGIQGTKTTLDSLNDLAAAGVRTALGLASANLDTQLGAIDDFLDTEIAAIKAKTDNLPATPAAIGSAMTLTSGERDSVADALLDLAAGVETNRTLRQALRLILAAAAGKVSGAAGTTVTIRDTNDSKDRIVATVDSSGNRSAVTLDGS